MCWELQLLKLISAETTPLQQHWQQVKQQSSHSKFSFQFCYKCHTVKCCFFSQLFPSIMSTSLSFCKWVHQELSADTTNVFSAELVKEWGVKSQSSFSKILHLSSILDNITQPLNKLIPTEVTDIILVSSNASKTS